MELPVNVKWNFLTKSKAEKGINPVQKKLFDRDVESVVPKIVESFVRESIQNSLDATLKGEKLEMLFTLRDNDKCIDPNDFEKLINGLIPHIESESSNVDVIPDWKSPIPFLSVEDFNTTGLMGDVSIDMPAPSDEADDGQDFCNFWRNLAGFTKKDGSERGKWGLGKAVFPASSKINTFYGITLRPNEDVSYLLGLSVLNIHRLPGAPNTIYKPYGDFGLFDDKTDDQFVMPISDKQFNEELADLFDSRRLHKGSGLSLYIPYPLEDFKVEFLIFSVIQQYYYPILKEEISVVVDYNESSFILNKDNLDKILSELNNPMPHEVDEQSWQLQIFKLKEILDFSHWICSLNDNDFTVLNPLTQNNMPRWNNSLFDNIDWENLKDKFANGERLAFKVPLWVKKGDKQSRLCHFYVYVAYQNNYDGFINEYIRHDLTIPEIRGLEKKGFKGFVIIENGSQNEDEPLVEMIGLSENPAHTTWSSTEEKFKKSNYLNGEQSLTFIKNALARIHEQLKVVITQKDDTLLADLFPLDNPDENEGDGLPTPPVVPDDPDSPDDPDIDVPPPMPPDINGSPLKLLITKIPDGFKVVKHSNCKIDLSSVSIQLGFKKKRKDPFRGYNPNDFNLQTNIGITQRGVITIASGPNSISFNVIDQNFEIKFEGFDPNRDLVINASGKP